MANTISILTPNDWHDYELIDSGDGEKLERFADYIISRPDPRVLWQKQQPQDVWDTAGASYKRLSDLSGDWEIHRLPPDNWRITYGELIFTLKPTAFKHVGVFPEQSSNWRWIAEKIDGKPLNILNLFAYTGAATLAAAAAGAKVTHVDASKPSITWARENAAASKLADKPIRWIVDDAYKFVVREAKRGVTYDGILMDPPRFGRGAKGEIWKLEQDLPKLMLACKSILTSRPAIFLLNAYTADLSSIAISNLVIDNIKEFGGTVESGELTLQDRSGRLLPNGIFARWSAS